MILATGAVHTHLVRQQLRTFTSLNVRSAECLDAHYFAVLIGVGATTVNAYLRRSRDRRPPSRAACSASSPSTTASTSYRKAVDEGLLKIMSKMGICGDLAPIAAAPISRRVGLSRTLVAEYLPRHARRAFPASAWPASSEACWSSTPAPATRTSSALPIGGFYSLPRERRDPCLGGQR